MKTFFPLLLVLFSLSCASTIGKPPAVQCDIYQARQSVLTGLGVGAAALAAGLGTITLATRSTNVTDVMKVGTVGISVTSGTLAWFGADSGRSAVEECKVPAK